MLGLMLLWNTSMKLIARWKTVQWTVFGTRVAKQTWVAELSGALL